MQVMLVTLTRVVFTKVDGGATWVVSSSGHGASTWSRPSATWTRCPPLGLVICTFITLAAAVAPTGRPKASGAATTITVSWFEENRPDPSERGPSLPLEGGEGGSEVRGGWVRAPCQC